MNKNSMVFWWKFVKDLLVPKPFTVIVPFTSDPDIFCKLLDGRLNEEEKLTWSSYLRELDEIATAIGYPIFIRGDLTAAKHNYIETCYLEKSEDISLHCFRLLESSLIGPGILPTAYILREFIPLEHKFVAFKGLPIAREYRIFAQDGKVFCCHFYWPEAAIEFYGTIKEPDNWRDDLKEIELIRPNDAVKLFTYAEKITLQLPSEERWSLDFAQGQNGIFYFIDCALAANSWHPECSFMLRP
jgi:hypothetical protein